MSEMVDGTAVASDPVGRILLVEDDHDYAGFLVHVLQKTGGHAVTPVADAEHAVRLLGSPGWDVLITDIHLPDGNGLDIVRRARELTPSTRTVVMTAFASVDSAVDALRNKVDEFLTKPVRPGDLLETVNRLLLTARAAAKRRQRVLAIGAHPDDVEIGVAGILVANRAAGNETAVLTLTCGAEGGERAERAREARAAAEFLGAELYLRDLTDTEISEGQPTVAVIEEVINAFNPTVVYTHSVHDNHQDHRNTSLASTVACRKVPRLYCYQSPSATVDFRPTLFVGIDDFLDDKMTAIEAYRSQYAIREYLAPDLTRATARYWGRLGPSRYAESLEVVRDRTGVVGADQPDSADAVGRDRAPAVGADRGAGTRTGANDPGDEQPIAEALSDVPVEATAGPGRVGAGDAAARTDETAI